MTRIVGRNREEMERREGERHERERRAMSRVERGIVVGLPNPIFNK